MPPFMDSNNIVCFPKPPNGLGDQIVELIKPAIQLEGKGQEEKSYLLILSSLKQAVQYIADQYGLDSEDVILDLLCVIIKDKICLHLLSSISDKER